MKKKKLINKGYVSHHLLSNDQIKIIKKKIIYYYDLKKKINYNQ